MDLDADVMGILITGITSGGAADKVGLISSVQQMVGPGRVSITYGDVITAVGGQPLRTYEELISYIFNQTEVGQTISLGVLRDGKEKTIELKLQGD
jgi:S1-C subfamily serine protease